MLSDYTQREEALDISKSFIIQAPAGSGKTELLAKRYLKLLSVCNNPENILVITFTKKATAEIKERIIQSLEMSKPSSEYKQQTFELAQQVIKRSDELGWNILQNYQRLNILTIDGLCNKIVNNYPQHNDFTHKSTLDEAKSQEFYERSAKNTLLEINTHNSVKNLFASVDVNSESFIKVVAKMLSIRDKWITKLFDDTTINITIIKRCVKQINQEYLQKINALSLENLGNNFINLCATSSGFSHIKKIPTTVKGWQDLKQLLFTNKNTLRARFKGFTKKNIENTVRFEEIVHNFSPEFVALLHAVEHLPDENINTEFLKDIATVLFIANTHLQHQFDTHNATDFIQIALQANLALSGNIETTDTISDIALTLDYNIEHILLDEFQDTSYTQLELLESLTQHWEKRSGRTLFLVGDPMQAIYGFRGGEVGVFLQVWNTGLTNISLHNLTLTQNFRSTSSVVDANNDIFQTVFAGGDTIDGEDIVFTNSFAEQSDTKQALHIYPFGGNSKTLQAEQVLEIVQRHMQENPHKEIAILSSARVSFIEIIECFNANNIEFEAVKNVNLANNIWTLELLALVQILLNSENKLAWCSWLRSAKIGLTLDEILEISNGAGGILQNLKHSESPRADMVYQVFNRIFVNYSSFTMSEIFLEVIENFDFYTNISDTQQIILNKFYEIIVLCEAENNFSEDYILQKLGKLYEPSKSSNVKLMTIHESKGLEFDVVILPYLEKQPRGLEPELIYLQEFKDFGMLLATKADEKNYTYLQNKEKQNVFNERKRLLYVAMTRAKEQIHLLGSVAEGKTPHSNSLLHLLWQKFGTQWQGVKDCEELSLNNPHTWGRYPLQIKEAATITRLEQHSELNHAELDANIIGVAVHTFLQLEIFTPSVAQVKNKLLQLGITFSNLESSIKTITNMLTTTKNSDDFDFIFKTRKSTQVEAECIEGGNSFIIDRFFIDNDVLWIIDFKTHFSNPQHHKKQLDNYKNILQHTYNYPITTAIFFTDIGKLEVL